MVNQRLIEEYYTNHRILYTFINEDENLENFQTISHLNDQSKIN